MYCNISLSWYNRLQHDFGKNTFRSVLTLFLTIVCDVENLARNLVLFYASPTLRKTRRMLASETDHRADVRSDRCPELGVYFKFFFILERKTTDTNRTCFGHQRKYCYTYLFYRNNWRDDIFSTLVCQNSFQTSRRRCPPHIDSARRYFDSTFPVYFTTITRGLT